VQVLRKENRKRKSASVWRAWEGEVSGQKDRATGKEGSGRRQRIERSSDKGLLKGSEEM